MYVCMFGPSDCEVGQRCQKATAFSSFLGSPQEIASEEVSEGYVC